MKLNELKMGESGIITKILAKEPLKSRLFSMGFARGEKVKVLKYTLAKNTYEVEINNIPIALREEEAEQIDVKKGENK